MVTYAKYLMNDKIVIYVKYLMIDKNRYNGYKIDVK